MKNLTLSTLILSALLWLAPLVCAQPQSLISNGDFAKDGEGWTYQHLGTQNPAMVFVDAGPTPELTRAFHAEATPEVEPKVLKAYSVEIRQPLNRAIKTSETFVIKFWARSPQSNTLAAAFGTSAKPIHSFLYKKFVLTPEWKHYDVEAVSKEDLAMGEAQLAFHLAFAPGTIELTGVEVLDETTP